MLYHIKKGQFREYLSEMEKMQHELKKYYDKLNALQKSAFTVSMAMIYFGAGKYDESIEQLNKIRNVEDFDVRQDVESAMKLFYLIVHFEKGNTELVFYLEKSLHRYLAKKKRLFKFENIILKFLGKGFLKINSKNNLVNEFKKLKSELLPIENDPKENAPFKEFDYISWLESKIENKSFAEIVKRISLN